MFLRHLKDSGRIIQIQYPIEKEEESLKFKEWTDPIPLEDQSILDMRIHFDEPNSANGAKYSISNLLEDGQQILERHSYYSDDASYILLVSTPTEVLLNEKIEELKKEFEQIEGAWWVVRSCGQDGKTISKRTETAINKYCEEKSLSYYSSYWKYDNKRLNIRSTVSGGFLCQIDIYLKYDPKKEWEQIHNWFIRELRWREESILNIRADLTRLDLYKELSDKMRDLRTEIEKETFNSSNIIKQRFPLLFGFDCHLSK